MLKGWNGIMLYLLKITGKGQYIGKSFDDRPIYASIVMHYG
jgi:hypothetical protein